MFLNFNNKQQLRKYIAKISQAMGNCRDTPTSLLRALPDTQRAESVNEMSPTDRPLEARHAWLVE